uniref:Uncharacterized protein n=1 Tax=Oryza meridionalis TaxID=40149 RepID=A0A0E0E0J0_9ORYZ
MERERDNGERGLTTIGNASFPAADDGVEGEEDTMELSLSVSSAQGWRAGREEAPTTCAGCYTSHSSPSSGHRRPPLRHARLADASVIQPWLPLCAPTAGPPLRATTRLRIRLSCWLHERATSARASPASPAGRSRYLLLRSQSLGAEGQSQRRRAGGQRGRPRAPPFATRPSASLFTARHQRLAMRTYRPASVREREI